MRKNKNKVPLIIFVLILLVLPLFLIGIKQTLNNRSNAASANALEAEGGTLSGNASKQSDTQASGESYVVLGLNPTNSPSPINSSTNIYGPLVVGDSLNNSQVGGTYNRKVANRFRATENSALNSIRIYIIDQNNLGYGGGTGGSMKISVQTDDGSSNHAPTGTELTSMTASGFKSGAGILYSFPNPPTLTKGDLYHIVFENIDPNPTVNFVSTDLMYQFNMDGNNPQWQPGISNIDWAELTKLPNNPWTSDRGNGQGTNTPIMQLTYANGNYAGVGYIEFWSIPNRTQTKTIIGSTDKVREKITVSGGDKIVTAINVKLKRVNGTGPLSVKLEKSDGTIIEQGNIASSLVQIGDPNNLIDSPHWASYQFTTPRTLTNGQSYNLIFSTDANTQYNFFAIRKGKAYGYNPLTYFADGNAQETSDGGITWLSPISWIQNTTPRDPEADWQFNFSISNQTLNPTIHPVTPTPLSGTAYNVPSNIDKTGTTDASSALNTWLASIPNGTVNNPSIITFPSGAIYRMDHGLKFSDRSFLTFEGNGATLKSNGAIASIESDSPIAMWSRNNNIIIRNYNIIGDWPGSYTTTKEGLHAVVIQGNNIEIYGLTINNVWGDAFYIGDYSNTVNIHDNHIISSGRNAVSIISGQNITVINNTIDRSAYVTFDIEPNNSTETISNVNFKQNTVGKWDTAEFFAIDGSNTGAPISNITVDTNTITGSSLKAWSASANGRKQNIKFINNKSSVSISGPVLTFSNIDGLTVTGNAQPLTGGALGSYSNNTNATTSPNP